MTGRRFRISVRGLMIAVLGCALIAKILVGAIFPNRLANEHFAIIGTIDLDRDGLDDQLELEQIIVDEGGVVDFKISAAGQTSGEFDSTTNWYVMDDRMLSERPCDDYRALKPAIQSLRGEGVAYQTLARLLFRTGRMRKK